MGFFDSLSKIIQGKPVYDVPQTDPMQPPNSMTDAASRPHYDASGKKIIPKVIITHTKPVVSGANMDVWARIHNYSESAVRLKNISLLGVTRPLANFLSPGEQEEVLVYSGPRLTNDSYTKAELYFDYDDTKDYFCCDHVIKYDYEPDGTYVIRQLEPYDYTRDV